MSIGTAGWRSAILVASDACGLQRDEMPEMRQLAEGQEERLDLAGKQGSELKEVTVLVRLGGRSGLSGYSNGLSL
jgi:hypothetical protein